MNINNPLNIRQTSPNPLTLWIFPVGPVEPLKNLRLVLLRNSDAIILYLNNNQPFLFSVESSISGLDLLYFTHYPIIENYVGDMNSSPDNRFQPVIGLHSPLSFDILIFEIRSNSFGQLFRSIWVNLTLISPR